MPSPVTMLMSPYGRSCSWRIAARSLSRTLVAFVIVAIVAGILAAILPARRASRLNVLHALQYE